MGKGAYDLDDEFAEQTVSCGDYSGGGRCMAYATQRHVEGDFAKNLLALAISDIQRRDAGKSATSRSITLAEVSSFDPLPLTNTGEGVEPVGVHQNCPQDACSDGRGDDRYRGQVAGGCCH